MKEKTNKQLPDLQSLLLLLIFLLRYNFFKKYVIICSLRFSWHYCQLFVLTSIYRSLFFFFCFFKEKEKLMVKDYLNNFIGY